MASEKLASADLKPLVTHIYTADPSAHVFNGRIYVYPSHDIKTDIKDNDNGDQYAMDDYHVLSLDTIGGPVTDHGVALSLKDIPWASKQLWAPDAATKNGKYYLYFPARNHDGVFQIGVGVSDKPEGPFVAEKEPIKGSYSIDPASFVDDDGQAYLYFGGIWGGQRMFYLYLRIRSTIEERCLYLKQFNATLMALMINQPTQTWRPLLDPPISHEQPN
jgi:hypothetical protein